MKLGLSIGYAGRTLAVPLELVQLAERLGYHSVWTAETYGSDAVTPLAWIAAHTRSIGLGTSVMQLAGRTPAMAAMQMLTLDALAGGGRAIAGVGVSGPQIVEGWYGQPWGKPYQRLKDYAAIMEKIFAREEPVSYEGTEYSLPFHGPGSIGLGKPLKSILHPSTRIPIWLGVGGKLNVRLCAEVADGWLPLSFVPGETSDWLPSLREGFRRRQLAGRSDDFEICPSVRVEVTEDVRGALQRQKEHLALYVGGMGHRSMNFHANVMSNRGYDEVTTRVQELFLAGSKTEAAQAIPDEYVDDTQLVGPAARISRRFEAWAASGLTGLRVRTTQAQAVELMAGLAREHPGVGISALGL